MKYKAVIFDLFGTLLDNDERILRRMAAVLLISPSDFIQLWHSALKGQTSEHISDEKVIFDICQNVRNKKCTKKELQAALQIKIEAAQNGLMEISPDAIESLTSLKSKGLKIGLISNCSNEVPMQWENCILSELVDVAVFSATVGLRKPDPRIYNMALAKLEVKAPECLYIGDGSSYELTGALKVGMHPVRIRIPAEIEDNFRIDEEAWDGTVISSLKEVIDLLQ